MSPYRDMSAPQENSDNVWKALADPTRRALLDSLAERPLTTGELAARFDTLCRTAVMKHLEILVEAHLVIVRREGRQRWNYINPAPIQSVCHRWVSKHVQGLASALSRLKEFAEEAFENEVGREKASSSGGDVRKKKPTDDTSNKG